MFDRIFLNGGAGGGWIGIFTGGSNANSGGIAVDADKNIYISGYTDQSGSPCLLIAKLNNEGVIQWQRRMSGAFRTVGNAIALDSSNNIYACGYSVEGQYSPYVQYLVKYNNSGTLQWQRTIQSFVASYGGNDVATDSSGNVYMAGDGGSSSNDTCGMVTKYNSSGTYQTTLPQGISGTNRYEGTNGVRVDASGNIYACGVYQSFSPSSVQRGYVIKYNSSGTELWQKGVIGNNDDYFLGLAINSSGDVYAVGQNKISVDYCFLVKYNTSGTLQWQRRLGNGVDNGGWRQAAVDSSGNVIVVGYFYVSGSYDIILAKYNSSGTLQWQRRLSGGAGFGLSNGVDVDADGNIYILGGEYIGSGDKIIVAKLPGDGSGTGTYSVGGFSITYAAITLTDSTPTYTDENPGLGGAPFGTQGTPSFTSATPTLTLSVTQL